MQGSYLSGSWSGRGGGVGKFGVVGDDVGYGMGVVNQE